MIRDNPVFDDPDQAERWLTIYEVAGQLLARPETVRTWVRDGLLPAEDRGRLGLRIPKRSVDEFVIKHLQSSGFRSADHSLSSGVAEDILTATEVPEQAVERQGAGWPFRREDGPGETELNGKKPIPGGL